MTWMTGQAELRDAGNDDNYISNNLASSTVPNLLSSDWLSYYADMVAGAVQYGNRTTLCNALAPSFGKSQTEIANALIAYGDPTGADVASYDRTLL